MPNNAGSVTVNVAVSIQPAASVAVTVYVPAAKPVRSSLVSPSFHK
ncbi:MAG: hypothetical protein IPO27_13820 [Bacteroidetes bacterium]|nr:hypothetical protein [Bacteroidota bacterium]